ncbi:MAG TPA: hypothetical protein VGK45_01260 [Thermoanaerobaculia bacterium]
MQTVGWLDDGIAGEAAAEAAAARGVAVIPLSRYSRGLLGFAAVDAREIRRGARELAVALSRRLR